ncbi:hypothetical protein F751_4933 [Auxenochlorella protothecoides]|uniref:Uncharacterized protein n=1 Tax=Auxenochlorella protothecoides TaxID=3075 RepID=A0A087SMB8_AUXPR|nr:hypothetical protein F751_4933 [Auxenochlorella protothecoides]KFM26872.1 hypothetical protein F751_4933 [Auxenochlorella protothecoides]
MPSDPYDLEEGIPKPEPGTAGGFYDAQGFWRTGWWNGQSWREGYFGGEVWVDAAWDGEVWRDGIRLYIVDESLRAAYRREFIIRIDDGALQSDEHHLPSIEAGTAGGFYDANGTWCTGYWDGRRWREGYWDGERWIDSWWNGFMWYDGPRRHREVQSVDVA